MCLPSVLVLCCVPCLCLLVRPFPPPIRKKMCGGEATNPSVNVKVPCEARNQTDPPMGGSATCPPPVIPNTTRKKLSAHSPRAPHTPDPVESAPPNSRHSHTRPLTQLAPLSHPRTVKPRWNVPAWSCRPACGSGEDLWAGPGGQPAQHIGHVPEPAPILS